MFTTTYSTTTEHASLSTNSDIRMIMIPHTEKPPQNIDTVTGFPYNVHVPGTRNNLSSPAEPPENMMELGHEFSQPADIALGCLVLVMCFLALSGNSWSATYFLERRKKSLHSLLYSFMSVFDIVSSLISIPVIITLFSSRDPVVFESGPFCLIWTVLFYYTLRISIFLVLLISVTRTMGMTFPGNRMRRNAVLWSIALYSAFVLIVDVVYLSTGVLEVRYRNKEAFCEMFEPKDELLEYKVHAKIYTMLLKLELIAPSVIVFLSFVVGTILLVKQMESRRRMKKNEAELRYASITVAIFTAIFLICNLPCFCVQLIYFISEFHDMSHIRGNVTFRHYGHLVSVLLLPLLNSALNPCLYITRMPQFKSWSSRQSIEIKIKGKRWTLFSAKSQSSTV